MDLLSQIAAANRNNKAKPQRVDWDEVKRRIRVVLTHIPATRKDLIARSRVTSDQFDKAIKELVAVKTVEVVYPGEFARRAAYILAKK